MELCLTAPLHNPPTRKSDGTQICQHPNKGDGRLSPEKHAQQVTFSEDKQREHHAGRILARDHDAARHRLQSDKVTAHLP